IYANAELASVRGRLEHTNASPSGSSINHIGTLIDLRLGDLAALGGVVPGRRSIAGHVVENFGHAGRLGATDITAAELADQRDIHAPDEADLLGLGGHSGQDADEVGTLMLLEHQRAHI